MRLYDLKTAHMQAPAIDRPPYFSWKLESERQNVLQTAYRIVVTCSGAAVWDSGRVESRKQSFVKYEGAPLTSRSHYDWTVTVWDNQGETAQKSGFFEAALLAEADWQARWVEYPFTREGANEYKFGSTYPPVWFKRAFSLEKPVVKARLYATAHGVYRLWVNGQRPDDREFAPEFTPYEQTLYYQTYDVTGLLARGENELALYVGDGWYFSPQAQPVMKNHHAEPSVLFQLEVEYADGTGTVIGSDGSERCSLGTILYSDLFQGEKVDLRREKQPEAPVKVMDYGYGMLQAQPMPPVWPAKLLPAVDVFTTPKGETVVDFGQVLAGWARVHLDVPAGVEVSFDYFEVLSSEGNYLNTMFAPQHDTVISDGTPVDYEPAFTFHGFRYVKVIGLDRVRKEDFTAVLLTTGKENIGDFDSSDPRLNRLYQNIRWSQWNNMLSVPTDCPAREKAAWTGDILAYAKTALLNEDVTPFLTSWLRSVRTCQGEDGVVMIVNPYTILYDSVLQRVVKEYGDDCITGVAGWSDAVVWVPYEMYRATGNTAVLEENYAAMKAWCKYILRTAREKRGYRNIPEEYDQYLWNTGFHFGEWLIPSQPQDPKDPYATGKTNAYYIAPYISYRTMTYMAETAGALSNEEDLNFFTRAADKIKWAIQQGLFYSHQLPDDLMGAYLLPIAFDLVPEDLMDEFRGKLVKLIRKNGNCLNTGFLATPFLLDALCKVGETKLAYEVFWQDKMPSWFYEVDHGATAIWEAWDADEAQQGGRYVSYDHYAFGCVDTFIFEHIAGIRSDTPGFTHVTVCPDRGSGLEWCRRSFVSEAGELKVAWDKDRMEITIPPNMTATVIWNGKTAELGSGNYCL